MNDLENSPSNVKNEEIVDEKLLEIRESYKEIFGKEPCNRLKNDIE
jgi:hypothetical protein